MTDRPRAAIAGAPAIDVSFEERRVLLRLADGRTLAAPLSWVGPTVAAMDAVGRTAWELTADGRGVNWPAAGQSSADGTLNVWTLEQDALFETALAELSAKNWDGKAAGTATRELVCLWRLVVDGYNGGLMQFLGNWGIADVELALEVLPRIGAARTVDALRAFWDLVRPIATADDVSTIDDVHRRLVRDHAGQADDLDHALWDAAEGLTVLVSNAYGPAPSAL